ncbi:hypothetical protein GCM10011579_055560 [Streptomyces albiflavescens]|uniref:Uncharacterized protein n=1 Tax=Streptomyces albiflavescens TaxID=1623582 RepID=A0A917Y785_9ACTN|nr:hypothetical protein GCM10011579_055560 [Streptomyces albiflavescens]
MWEVRLWGELLLNTDSFCVAAGRAARGDRTMGDPSGQNRRYAEPGAWGSYGISQRHSYGVAVK